MNGWRLLVAIRLLAPYSLAAIWTGQSPTVATVWGGELRVARRRPFVSRRMTRWLSRAELVRGGSKGKRASLPVAVVLEKPGVAKLATVACDVLFTPRDLVDPALAEIEAATGIPPAHVLVSDAHPLRRASRAFTAMTGMPCSPGGCGRGSWPR